MRRDSILLAGLVLALAVFYGTAGRRIEVGYFNDDARYIASAKSLELGSYRNLELPGLSPNIDRLPGYPMFLLPFVHLIGPHWEWLKVTSIALTCGALLLLAFLFQDWMPPKDRLLWILIIGLNPTIMKYSCSVMSEPFFLFLVTATLVAFKKWLASERSKFFWLTSASLAGAVLTRPEGLALLAALPCGLALGRRWRRAWTLLIVPSAALVLVLARNQWTGQSASTYLYQMDQIFIQLAGNYFPLILNGLNVLRNFLVDTLLQASFPLSSAWAFLCFTGLSCAAVLALSVKGFCSLARRNEPDRTVHRVIGFFAVFYLVMHGIFLSVNSRYCFALIPFGLAWLAAGAAAMRPRFVRPRLWVLTGLGGLLFLYENPWSSPADKIIISSYAYTIPRQTYAWIHEWTAPNAFVLAIKASTVYLYTDRHAISEIPAADLDDFERRLRDSGITHILIAPSRLLVLQNHDFQGMLTIWQTADQWLAGHPAAYKKVYENLQEKTSLYQVLPADPSTRRLSIRRQT